MTDARPISPADLTHTQRAACLRLGKELGFKAAENHAAALAWAHASLRTFVDENRADAKADGVDLDVSVTPVVLENQDKLAHQVAAVTLDSDKAVTGRHLVIQVTTGMELGGTLDELRFAYRTTTQALIEGMLAKLRPDLVVGAVVY